LDATELPGVIGHEREFQTTGVRRDEEIVRADHRFNRFERSADHKYMFLLSFITQYVRDVGVAGSNPVTPTIDFLE
jgi:hypothetical protein